MKGGCKLKKIVIIGANDFQNKLIIKAKEKGYETHVFAWKCGDEGELTADYFYPISIIEKEKILKKCIEIKPDAICSIASDLAMITVSYVANKLNLISNSEYCTDATTNKYKMRQIFFENGDPSPKSFLIKSFEESNKLKLEFPVIVKPTDRSGSRGITKVDNEIGLKKAIEDAMKASFEKKVLIEEYVDGEEYSVEYISFKGKHDFLTLTKKITTGPPNFIEVGHIQPVDIKEELLYKIKLIISKALTNLGVMNGASHSEIKIKNDKITIIEIGARMGGDCIGSDLVKLSTGFDYLDMVIDISFGRRPIFKQVVKPKNVMIKFLFSDRDIFKLNKLKEDYPELIVRVSSISEDEKKDIKDSSERLGYYIISSDSLDEINYIMENY